MSGKAGDYLAPGTLRCEVQVSEIIARCMRHHVWHSLKLVLRLRHRGEVEASRAQ